MSKRIALLLGLALLLPVRAWAALAIQGTNRGCVSATSCGTGSEFNTNLTVGNLVICSISLSGSVANPTPTVASATAGGDSMSKIPGASVATGSGLAYADTEIWAITVAHASQEFHANTATAASIGYVCGEFDGTVYTLTLDGATPSVVTNTGNNATPTTGSISTTNANDLLIWGVDSNQLGTNLNSPTNSFGFEAGAGQMFTDGTTGNGQTFLITRSVGATGTYSSAVTGDTANWTTVLVALQKVGGAPASTTGEVIVP